MDWCVHVMCNKVHSRINENVIIVREGSARGLADSFLNLPASGAVQGQYSGSLLAESHHPH